MNTLAAFWPHGLLTLALILICGLLMLVILIQKGRGGGLSGAFGGGGGGSTAFGTKTGDVFTWITIALASMLLLLTIVANHAFDPTGSRTVAAVPAVPTGVPTGVRGTTESGEDIGFGELPDAGLVGGGLDEDSDAGSADPAETPPAGGGGTEAPPPQDHPVTPPATPAPGTDPPAESDGGGTPAP
jgi:preprotein translocase subunit SecG